MNIFIKTLFGLVVLIGWSLTAPVFAQEKEIIADNEGFSAGSEKTFTGLVKEVFEKKEITREDGSIALQQNVKIVGLDRGFEGQEKVVIGVGDLEFMQSVTVKPGDKVLVQETTSVTGEKFYVITDSVRTGALFWLFLLFCFSLIILGRGKGLKSLLSLALTFLVVLKLLVPMIINGWNPVFASVLCSILILGAIIYVTWGFNKKAHVAVVSILGSLIITGIISVLFTEFAKLSGIQEDATFLIGMLNHAVDFKGLLLAGIIIGTLGVLDDVVISQISAVEQLIETNPHQSARELYRKGLVVGVDHISSMTNTLFLAYAGAAIPLLLLFSLDDKASFTQILNNELIATEIVRTLCGSIGLIFAVPVATIIAAVAFKKNN